MANKQVYLRVTCTRKCSQTSRRDAMEYRQIFPVLIMSFISVCKAGKYVTQTTTDDHKFYYLNDLGVKLKDYSPLYFELKSCQDGIMRLAETQDLDGNYYDIVIGAGSNTWSGLRNRCVYCGVDVSYHGPILSCSAYTALWVAWTGNGNTSFGTGVNAYENTLLTFSDTSHFEINYIVVASYYGVTGEWRLLIDDKPSFQEPNSDGSTTLHLSETLATGHTVLKLTAVDPENNVLTYTLHDHHLQSFELQGADLKLSKALDFETDKFFTLILSVSDGRNSVNVSLTIMVTDECDESPEILTNHLMSLPEELEIGFLIGGFFSARDKDSDDPLVFTLAGNDASHFHINSSTGAIRVASRLDYDGNGGRQFLDDLILIVNDSCGHQTSTNLNISVQDINDNTPVPTSTIIYANIAENSTSDTFVAKVIFTDADSHTHSLILTIVDGDDDFNSIFTITGDVIRGAGNRIDYETNPRDFLLTVQAVDQPSTGQALTGTCLVSIKVLPVNEFPPELIHSVDDQDLWISESVTSGTRVTNLKAVDLDMGKDGELAYTIENATTANGSRVSSFVIDMISGEIKTSGNLDRDDKTGGTEFFDVVAMVTDKGIPAKTAVTKIRIQLVDENDNSHHLSEDSTSAFISCSHNIGDVIMAFNVTDIDEAARNYSYHLVYTEVDVISLNRTNGELILKNEPHLIQSSNFSFVLEVRDNKYSVYSKVSIKIENCSSNTTNISTTETVPTSLTTTTTALSQLSVKYSSGLHQAGVIETWFLRATCGLLTMAVTACLFKLCNRADSRSLETADNPENRVTTRQGTDLVSSPTEDNTDITSLSSLDSSDYFQ